MHLLECAPPTPQSTPDAERASDVDPTVLLARLTLMNAWECGCGGSAVASS